MRTVLPNSLVGLGASGERKRQAGTETVLEFGGKKEKGMRRTIIEVRRKATM